MADNISTLLGMGLSPQDDMKALAASLRNEQAVGDYFSGSSSPKMSAYGQNLAKRSGDAAQRGGVLRQSMAQEAQRQSELEATNQRNLLSEGVRVSERDEDYTRGQADKTLAHTRAMEVKKLIAEQKAAVQKVKDDKDIIEDEAEAEAVDGRLKPTGKATEDYLKTLQLTGEIDNVLAITSEFNEEQNSEADQPGLDTLTSFIPHDSTERWVQDQFLYNDPKVKQSREKIANIESEFSKLMSGMSVTAYEMADRQKWSPYATGIDKETRERRLANLREKLVEQAKLKEKFYNLGSGAGGNAPPSSIERPLEDIQLAPGRTGGGDFEEEKTINGKRYGKRDGVWYEL